MNPNEPCETRITDTKDGGNNVKGNILQHLVTKYGGISSLVSYSYRGLNSLSSFRGSKKGPKIFKFISGGLIIYDIINEIREFRKSLRNKGEARDAHIKGVLNIGLEDSYRSDDITALVTKEMARWLLDVPSDSSFVIENFYDQDMYIVRTAMAKGYVELSVNGHRTLISIDTLSTDGPEILILRTIYSDRFSAMEMAFDSITTSYLNHVGWADNVLSFHGYDLTKRKRVEKPSFDILNVDMDRIYSEINYTMENGGRRGIILVGRPGTCKTSILLELESTLKDYPMIHISSSDLSDASSVRRLQNLISSLKRAIIYIEEMDTLEISDKNKKLEPILSFLDNSRAKNAMVFLTSVNHIKLLDKSLTRAGRFDSLIKTYPPRSKKEVDAIIKLSPINYWKCRMFGFVQADYAELNASMAIDGSSASAAINRRIKANLLRG